MRCSRPYATLPAALANASTTHPTECVPSAIIQQKAITGCITKVQMATAEARAIYVRTAFEALGTPQGCLIAHRNTSAFRLRRSNCDWNGAVSPIGATH